MKPLFCLALAALMFGCAVATQQHDSASVAASTVIKKDEYTKATWITAPETLGNGVEGCYFHLRAFSVTPGLLDGYQLYVRRNSSEWLFPRQAWHRNGTRLNIINVDTDVQTYGGVREDFAVELTKAQLEAGTAEGLDIRLDGKRSVVVRITPQYCQGFMATVAKFAPGH